jgi:phage terminase small subunit
VTIIGSFIKTTLIPAITISPRRRKRAATKEAQRDRAAPPADLSAATRAWWARILAQHDIKEHQLRTLLIAARSWDRSEEARQALSRHGLEYTDDRGMVRPRPSVAIERDSQIRYLRAMRELGLDRAELPDRNGSSGALGINWRQLEEMRR